MRSTHRFIRRILVLLPIVFVFVLTPALAQNNVDVAVLPADLGRLSWGAIIAGAIIALMVQLALNLLGVGVGVTTITADPHDPKDEATPLGTAARTTAVWVGVSTLISLFIGGWLAARFAGIPNGLDGMLHGLMVWGVVMLITLLLITTTVGRLFSSLSNLIGQAMTLLTRVTGAAAQTAANVAGAAASAAGSVAGSAAQGVSNAVSSVGSAAAGAAREAAQQAQPAIDDAREQIDERVQQELDKHPELRQAMSNQTAARQKIEEEARNLIAEAGIEPERIEAEVQDAAFEVKQAAQTAAEQVASDPRQAVDTLMSALSSILERGSNVVSSVDRQSVIDILKTRTGQTEEQAAAMLQQWEDRLQQARGETERIRGEAETKIRNFRQDAEAKVNQIRTDVEEKVDDIRHDIDLKARETAAAATKAISRLALAAFGAIVIGAFSAGFGGAIGAPEQLPVAQVDIGDDLKVPLPTPTPFILPDPTATPGQ